MALSGLEHYEVSNYAVPGEEARHNLHYWRGGAYVGVGAGAVGCVDDPVSKTAERWRSEPLPARYLEASGTPAVTAWREQLSPRDRMREALMLGLRTREGLSTRAIEESTGLTLRDGRESALARRLERGELEMHGGSLRVPARHWLALDAIVTDLF
jgi:oxygen-independent coproporphyrinogen-3 oxidase